MLIQIHILNKKTVQIQISHRLIWLYTVCKDKAYPGSGGPGLKLVFLYLQATHEKMYFLAYAPSDDWDLPVLCG